MLHGLLLYQLYIDILQLIHIWYYISGDGHCPPKMVGEGGVKMAKHKCGLLAKVLLRVPAVKVDALVMDYSKVGVVVHMLALTNGTVTCADPGKENNITKGSPQGISRGKLIDQFGHCLDLLIREVGLILGGGFVPGCTLVDDGWEHFAALMNVGNEGVTIVDRLVGCQQILYPFTIDLMAGQHAEILGALVDSKVHHLEDARVQPHNKSISKCLGLQVVGHVDVGDDDMP